MLTAVSTHVLEFFFPDRTLNKVNMKLDMKSWLGHGLLKNVIQNCLAKLKISKEKESCKQF